MICALPKIDFCQTLYHRAGESLQYFSKVLLSMVRAFLLKTKIKTCVYISLFIFVSAALMLTSCDRKDQLEKQYKELLSQAIDLEHRHCQLKVNIDSLWDTTSVQLAHLLPSDFPTTDRNIFLKARNAEHIKMFMSFKQLDSSAQSLVNNAGKYDEVIARQVHKLLEEKQAFEKQKIEFLQKAEQQGRLTSQMYTSSFQTAISKEACR